MTDQDEGSQVQTISIIGASGFIGRNLVSELVCLGGFKIRVHSRDPRKDAAEQRYPPEVELIQAHLDDTGSLVALFEPGCTVVNLVYLWDAGEAANLAVTNNLVEACRVARVGRLVHVSTAAVAGRVRPDNIKEDTPCNPLTEYGITKWKIEQAIATGAAHCFDAVILRPTAVFGIEGEPLKKLAKDLLTASRWVNYVRSCLFGERRTNLVHVRNVVSAIIFLTRYPRPLEGEVFIVSDDDDSNNNFAYVESSLMAGLGVRNYPLPRLALPSWVLNALLALRRRSNINSRCNYDPGKLLMLGFQRPVSLDEGLAEYSTWYRSTIPVAR